jgi:cell division septation protein DedD
MMLTFRAGKFAALLVAVALLSACSREQQDWRSAEASDTVNGYGEFLHRHPDSELATEARTRVAQLSEDREWQSAGTADTADAYKQFLAQHPNGKWAQEARIRVENFALGREGATAAPGVSAAVPAEGSGGVSGAATGSTYSSAAGSVAGTASGYGSGPGSAAASSPAMGSAWTGSSGSAAQAVPGEAARASTSGDSARPMLSPAAANAPAPTAPPPTQLASAAPVSPGEPARPLPPAQTSPAGSADASPAIAGAWRSDDGFGVQLGAFASENAATTEWQQLTARFSAQLRGLAPRVISANTSTGRLFRLQALVADEAAARTLCDMLRKQSQACVPVLPH